MSRSGYPPWILNLGGLESSNKKSIASFGETKKIAFFPANLFHSESLFEVIFIRFFEIFRLVGHIRNFFCFDFFFIFFEILLHFFVYF